MCAIAGLINLNQEFTKDQIKDIVAKMASKMSHRGPDDSGVWVDPAGRCALSHKRLIIIDKSQDGHQPMESIDRNYCLTYNGEIYNYLELREELKFSKLCSILILNVSNCASKFMTVGFTSLEPLIILFLSNKSLL